jgi:hypothetical protein
METATENTVTISVPELEAIIQRVVKETVREEIDRALFEFWTQEGEADPREDEILLRDALEQIEKYGDDHSSFITLEELEAELDAENDAIQNPNRAGSA